MREAVATLPSGVEIAYETFGDTTGRPLLLIMGLGGPALWWDLALCERLADEGFHVVRFDNRDIGRSTYFHQERVSRRRLAQAFLGRRSVAPYTMGHLADDAFGLLDHLGIEVAHVTGVSMGGMIAQTMAISRPERVRSLVSMMSTTGSRRVGWQDPRLLPMALARRVSDRDSYVSSSHRVWDAIGSPGFPSDLEVRELRAGQTWDRGINPDGVMRQTMAVLTQPDRTEDLGRLRIPTTVIHGTADRLVHPSGGRATAAAIPGAELVTITGLGHDLPPRLHGTFVRAITHTADRADVAAPSTPPGRQPTTPPGRQPSKAPSEPPDERPDETPGGAPSQSTSANSSSSASRR